VGEPTGPTWLIRAESPNQINLAQQLRKAPAAVERRRFPQCAFLSECCSTIVV